MPTFIITGNYTTAAIKGMIANPSDRKAAATAIVEAMGGKTIEYYATTGDTDFVLIVEAKDGKDLLPALMVTGASGTVSNIKTVRAYSSAEFTEAQKKASEIKPKYKPA